MYPNVFSKLFFIAMPFHILECSVMDDDDESSGSKEVRMINENAYLTYLDPNTREFLKRHNVDNNDKYWIKGRNRFDFDWNIEFNDIIFLFSKIFIKNAYESVIQYKDGLNIQYTVFESINDLQYYVQRNFNESFIASSNIMTYRWLRSLLYIPYNSGKRLPYDLNQRFVFISQTIPKIDHINLIWNFYNKIKSHKIFRRRQIIITLTTTSQMLINSRITGNKNLTNIFIKSTIGRNWALEGDVRVYEIIDDKLFSQFQNFIYQIHLFECNNYFELFLYTPTLNFKLQPKFYGTFLELSIVNMVTNIYYSFIFEFENSKLARAYLNTRKLPLSKQKLTALFNRILKIKENPYLTI